jgi:hypothetical protein
MLKVTNRTWKEAEHRTRVQKGESSCPAAARRHEVRMKDLLSWLGRKGTLQQRPDPGSAHATVGTPSYAPFLCEQGRICGQLGIVREIKRFGAIMGAADSVGQDE